MYHFNAIPFERNNVKGEIRFLYIDLLTVDTLMCGKSLAFYDQFHVNV